MKITLHILAIISAFTMATFSASTLASGDDFVGEISAEKLNQDYSDFNSQYVGYDVSEKDIALVKSIKSPIVIKALFGTWCHDSVREIPRLTKLLSIAKNSNISTTLITVDRKKTADEAYQLKYTPTIIVYQNNQEIGRIIEAPRKSIAQDIVDFIKVSEPTTID
jgi:thioredoxin 1